MIISIEMENSFDKIKHPFIIKVLDRLGMEGNIPEQNKDSLQRAHTQHQLKCRKP